MPGSWEITEMRRNRVLCALIVPNDYKVSLDWTASYAWLQLPAGSQRANVSGLPYGPARNQHVKTALDNGFGWLFFIDSDVIAPPDTVMRLLATGRDVISGVYRQRFAPWKIAAFNKAMVPVSGQPGKIMVTTQDVPKHNPGDIIPVDYIPAGCLLISRRALEAVISRFPKPFEWTVDIDRPGEGLSEDYVFCDHARALGFQTWLHTGVDLRHEVSMTIGPNAELAKLGAQG